MKIKKLIFTNLILLTFFISVFDILFGRLLLKGNPPVSSVPYALWNLKVENDISDLYEANKKKISYKRDKKGYHNLTENKNIILTIGGSTTDQRYISEEYTWQNLINNKIKDKNISVVNGGFPGQSLVGHIYSIHNWHSKSLDKNKVKKVIFYMGANDFSIFQKLIIGHNIRLFLANNSFLYSKFRHIRYSHINKTYTRNDQNIIFWKKT